MSGSAIGMTFEQFCQAVDARARSEMPQSDSARLVFNSVNTTDGLGARKQVGRWTFNGNAVIFNALSDTGALAGVEAASNPKNAPTQKVISIRPEGLGDAVQWIRWLTTET
jgi:hypothetical protein